MQPIIEYHGPFFQVLRDLVMRAGYERTLLAWRLGVVCWLALLGALAISKQYPRLFTAVALAGVFGLRLPGLGMAEQNVDESQWITSAATLVQDSRFWVSVDGTTSGPFNIWPLTLIHYAGFGLDYATLRLWGLLTCGLPTIWLLLATCRLHYGERVARYAILPVAACLALTTDPDGVAFNSEQWPMCLLALTGYLLSLVFKRPAANPLVTAGRLLAAGLVLGSLPYTKLQSAPVGVAIAVWALIGLFTQVPVDRAEGRKQVVWLVTGGLLPTVMIGVYSAWIGITDFAVRAYLLTNLVYARQGSWSAGTISWLDRLLIRLPQVYGGMPGTGWFWCLVAAAGLLGVFARRPVGRWVWVAGSVLLVSIYTTLQPGNPFPHYQWIAFVPAAWLLGGLSAAGVAAKTAQWPRLLVAGGAGTALLYAGSLAVIHPNPAIRQLADGGCPSTERSVSAAISRYASPNETMVVWGWQNNLYVESGLLTGSRFIPIYHPVVEGPQQAYFLDVCEHDLQVNQPAIFVDAVGLHAGHGYDRYPVSRYAAVQSTLNSHYRLMETVQGAKIYRRMRPVEGAAYSASIVPGNPGDAVKNNIH